jgi:hypothetical protein
MNEANDVPTFETIRGRSWIDLTISNNILAKNTRRWTCGEEESCSDHKLILFDIEGGTLDCNTFIHARKLYLIKAEDWHQFENKLVTNMLSSFNCVNNTSDLTQCDEELGETVKQFTDIDRLVSKFTSIIKETCSATFKISRAGDRVTKGRSVPWWTSELTVLRK